MKKYLVIIAILCFSVNVSFAQSGMRHVVLGVNKSFVEQVKEPNTVYEIRNDFELGKIPVVLPNNCILFFNGGHLKNGRLSGFFTIRADESQIFDNVAIDSINNSEFYAIWMLGNNKVLSNSFFTNLPKAKIIFNPNIEYSLKENVTLHSRGYTHFVGLHLTTKYSILKYSEVANSSKATGGNCQSTGDIRNRIQTDKAISSDVIGKMIIVKTCNHVKNDWRETSGKIPQLYKGLTSRIIDVKVENGKTNIYLEHPIEKFDVSTVYKSIDGKKSSRLYSTFQIYRSDIVILEDCHFVFTDRAGFCNFDASGTGSRIVNSSFQSTTGCGMLLGLGGVGMLVQNCSINGASYLGSGESYGIQVNGGTAIIIEACSFSNNRRAVDFSGNWESRYCIAKNNKVSNSTYIAYGSAMGGHSTSFANQFLNNCISGHHTSAFELRGEQEIVDGNICDAFLSSCFTQVGINSVIRNNFVDFYYLGSFVYNNTAIPNNTCTIENNKVYLRDQLIYDVVSDSNIVPEYIIRNNIIRIVRGRILVAKSLNNPISVFMNNVVTGELCQDCFQSVTINPKKQHLDGVSLPLTLKRQDGKDLTKADKAKLDSQTIGFIDFLPNQQVRIRLNFSLKNSLAEPVIINGLYNDIVMPAANDMSPSHPVISITPGDKRLIVSGSGKKIMGLETNTGLLSGGEYKFEGFL